MTHAPHTRAHPCRQIASSQSLGTALCAERPQLLAALAALLAHASLQVAAHAAEALQALAGPDLAAGLAAATAGAERAMFTNLQALLDRVAAAAAEKLKAAVLVLKFKDAAAVGRQLDEYQALLCGLELLWELAQVRWGVLCLCT